jgi:hypothetical protein
MTARSSVFQSGASKGPGASAGYLDPVLRRVCLGHIVRIGDIDKGADIQERETGADALPGHHIGSGFGFDEHVVILVDHVHRHIASGDIRQRDGGRLAQIEYEV